MNQSPMRILLLIVCAGFAASMLWKFSGPFVLVRQLKAETAPLRTEAELLRNENNLLQQKIVDQATPEMKLLEARRQGWIKPGERRIVFKQLDEPKETQTAMPPPKPRSFFSKARDWARQKAGRFVKKETDSKQDGQSLN